MARFLTSQTLICQTNVATGLVIHVWEVRYDAKVAERGGKNGKKRAVIVLLHRLWVSGEAYEPMRNQRAIELPAAA